MDISQRRRDKPPPLKGHKSHFKTRVRLWNKLIVQLLLCALCLLFGTTKIMTFSVGKVNNSILFGSTVERRQFSFFFREGEWKVVSGRGKIMITGSVLRLPWVFRSVLACARCTNLHFVVFGLAPSMFNVILAFEPRDRTAVTFNSFSA